MAKLNRGIFFIYILLMGLGLIFVVNSSVVDAYRDFGNRWQYLFRQLAWILTSLFVYLLISKMSIDKILINSRPIYWLGILSLILVLIPGIGVKIYGARRWLDIGISLLQPSEFVKTILIINLSAISMTKSRGISSFLLTGLVPLILIMLQPDLGTSLVIMSIIVSMYFVSGLSIIRVLPLVPIGLVILVLYIALSPYRMDRMKTYLGLVGDPQNNSYQSTQSLIAIGRGGVFGVGLGQSFQKFNFLPESSTDSIFSIIAEETGLLGSTFLLSLYLWMILTIFKISSLIENLQLSGLVFGIGILLTSQTLLNLGAITGLLPLTGIPLPFISYGGSSLLNFSISLGLISSVVKSCQTKNYRS